MNSGSASRSLVLVALVWTSYACYVLWSAGHLPARVATHFGLDGMPNGWMGSPGYVWFALIFGTAMPLFVLGNFSLTRRWNGWGLNIPHKEYWLAPERRDATFDYVQIQGLWLTGLLLALLAGMHHSVLVANTLTPVRLPTTFAVWAGAFLVAMIAWGTNFVGHFQRRPL